MPIYTFECKKGDRTEKVEPVGTTSIKCPKCGTQADKTWSVPADFQMKGKTPRFHPRTR